MPIRILHLISSFNVGGAERNLLNLLRYRQSETIQYYLACRRQSGLLFTEFEASEVVIKLLQWGKYSMYNPLRWREVGELVNYIRARQIDILHAHMPPSIIYGPLAAHRAGIVSIASVHAMRSQLSYLQYSQAKLMQNKINYFLEGSQAVTEDLFAHGISREKLISIPYGVDGEKFSSNQQQARLEFRKQFAISDSSFVIGRIARFHPDKGFDLLLQMVPMLKNFIPNLKVVLVGDGPQRAELQKITRTLNISEQVIFTGFYLATEKALAAFDLVAISAKAEALGISTLEAMAAGQCFVSYDTGGLTEVIRDGYNGLLIKLGRQAEFIEAIKRLYQQPEYCQRLGQNSRKLFAQKYSLTAMCHALEKFYGQTQLGKDNYNAA